MAAFDAKYGAWKRICNIYKYHLENIRFDIKVCLDISRVSRYFFFMNSRAAFSRQGERKRKKARAREGYVSLEKLAEMSNSRARFKSASK